VPLLERLRRWLHPGRAERHSPEPIRNLRGPTSHVVILDGTLSSLEPGNETNAGLTYRLLAEMLPRVDLSLYYEAGVQWQSWRQSNDVITGRGINRQIRRAYGFLASRYRPGDRIFLLGYSRGAYAVRSLAGVIDRIGLLRANEATVRNIRTVYRLYQCVADSDGNNPEVSAFAHAHCHDGAPIEMVGVWDTVKALGIRLPVLWRITEPAHAFHNHHLGPTIKHGFHALALHEKRVAFEPVMWNCPPGWTGHVEQMWFRGTHGDIGGQLMGYDPARPLSNIPLTWMLEKMEMCGLPLPDAWRDRFICDVTAPMVGSLRGWAKWFLLRRRRKVGHDMSEHVHPTALPYLHPSHRAVFEARAALEAAEKAAQASGPREPDQPQTG
jgi:uncharacterized protein (DUF2235 family)